MSDETQDETQFDDTPIEDTPDGSGYTPGGFRARLRGAVSGAGRTLLVAAFAGLAGVGIAAYYLMDAVQSDPPATGAAVDEAPDGRGVPTGEGGTERYQERVDAESEQRIREAHEAGGSAIPTLTDPRFAEMPDPACDEACRERLEAQIAEAQREAQAAREQARRAEEALAEARRAAQADGSLIEPEVYVHEGRVHRSPSAEADRESRIRSEMSRVAERVTSPAVHGYAEFVTMTNTASSSSANETEAGGQSTSGANAEQSPAPAEQSPAPTDSSSSDVLIPAAETRYATLDTTANTDVPSPVRATLQQGEFAGARLLGEFAREQEYLVIRFSSMTTAEGETIPIDAVALDPATRTAGLADEVDRHILQRLAAIGGAAFIQGIGEAVQASGTSVTIQGGNTVVESNDALDTTREQARFALGRVGEAAADIVRPFADRPITVVKYAGTGMSVLFLEPVTADN